MSLGRSGGLMVGQAVYAIGNPWGLGELQQGARGRTGGGDAPALVLQWKMLLSPPSARSMLGPTLHQSWPRHHRTHSQRGRPLAQRPWWPLGKVGAPHGDADRPPFGRLAGELPLFLITPPPSHPPSAFFASPGLAPRPAPPCATPTPSPDHTFTKARRRAGGRGGARGHAAFRALHLSGGRVPTRQRLPRPCLWPAGVLPIRGSNLIHPPPALSYVRAQGIVCGLGRELSAGMIPIKNVIQTDCTINPGNSGGVLLTSKVGRARAAGARVAGAGRGGGDGEV